MPAKSSLLFRILGLSLLLAVVACGPAAQATRPTPISEPVPSKTPFKPMPSSPTPGPVKLWISPAVPPHLADQAKRVASVAGRPVSVVQAQDQADTLLEPVSQGVSSEWVYALVAPFPTVRDGLTLDETKQAWAGELGMPVYATPETAQALQAVLGPPTGVTQVSASDIIDQAWSARPSLALVPFDELDPRWKVMQIDGRSPIENDFELSAYPLEVGFGFSGTDADTWRSETHLPTTNRDPAKLTVVAMTGVTALTRATAWQMDLHTPTWPADLIGDWLRSADITHVSNEVSFAEDCGPPDPSRSVMRFCTQPRQMALLDDIGVDVVELTGNHELDWGAEAMLYTLNLYDQKGWQVFGGGRNLQDAQKPALFDVHGNKIAFLGCNPAGPDYDWATNTMPGSLPCDMKEIKSAIQTVKAQGYLPIMTYQWEESYRDSPLPAQVQGFRAAADDGAIIVSGSQAHQPMGFEFYDGTMIHYGLGNLFFDQMWSLPTRQEMIDRHIFYDGRYISTEILTAVSEDYAQPRPMTASERADFLASIFQASGW